MPKMRLYSSIERKYPTQKAVYVVSCVRLPNHLVNCLHPKQNWMKLVKLTSNMQFRFTSLRLWNISEHLETF